MVGVMLQKSTSEDRFGHRAPCRKDGDDITLGPAITSPVQAMYGKYPDADLLDDLEEEHRQELEAEATKPPPARNG